MKKPLVALAIIFLISLTSASAQSNVTSQDYKTALGVKFYPGAFTFKHFIKPTAALEGIAYFYNEGCG